MVTGSSESKEGSIDMIIGPMFSGKTTELMKRVRRHLAATRKCLLIKYKGDIRYGQEAVLSTHDQLHMAAKSVATLGEVENAVWHYDVVAIDEGQFFPGKPRTGSACVCIQAGSACLLCRFGGARRTVGKRWQTCVGVSTGRHFSAQAIHECAGANTSCRERDQVDGSVQ